MDVLRVGYVGGGREGDWGFVTGRKPLITFDHFRKGQRKMGYVLELWDESAAEARWEILVRA